jgi:hypothetical protein
MEERLKILRTMNSATGKVDLNGFSAIVSMSRGRTLDFLQGLVKMGLIKKVEGRYSITLEGKIALKELLPVPQGNEFFFNIAIGQYTGLSARSLKEFLEILGRVNARSLEFHVSRSDFEKWIVVVFNDTELANAFMKARESKLSGENLRKELQSATTARYGKFENLLTS